MDSCERPGAAVAAEFLSNCDHINSTAMDDDAVSCGEGDGNQNLDIKKSNRNRSSFEIFKSSITKLILTERHCSVDVQNRLHYSVTEESRSGSGRRQVTSTNFQLVRHLEAAGTTGQQAASEVHQGQ